MVQARAVLCCAAIATAALQAQVGAARTPLFQLPRQLNSQPQGRLRQPRAGDPADDFLVQCAEELPACAPVWAQVAPPAFSVVVDSSQGPFTVHVNTSWAPPFAQRFYTLVLLSYFDGAPLYRVLPGFVSQFG